MLRTNWTFLSKMRQTMPSTCRFIHDDFSSTPPTKDTKKSPPKNPQKFQVFRDSDAQVILDVEEERAIENILEPSKKVLPDIDISLERGLRGVFEIEDLVTLLRKDNGINICVCKVPNELKYVDYICCVTGRNHRHMLGMAEYVRKVFKLKRHEGDKIPRLEGQDSKDWIAMDLGNIALHILSDEARVKYDIEQLWAVGSEYDQETNKVDDTALNLEKYAVFLEDLKPKTDG